MFDYVFLYRGMSIGGCQLLIQKYAIELSLRERSVLMCCSYMDESIGRKMRSANVVVNNIINSSWNNGHYWKEFLGDKISVRTKLFAFIWSDYLRLYNCAKARGNVFLYAVHYDTIKHATIRKHPFVEKVSRMATRRIVKSLIDNRQIIIMDEQTLEHTERYYKMSIPVPVMIRVPIEIGEDDFNLTEAVGKFKEKYRLILAIARAEFPFKGYLLGLVSMFRDRRVDDLYKLKIVSYGDDFTVLQEAVEACAPDVQDRIELTGKVEYDELRDLFYESHVYVGMGTTILDASRYGVMSIPVVPYTNEVKAKKLYVSDYRFFGYDDGSEERFLQLLSDIESLSTDELQNIISKTNMLVRQYYSIKSCADSVEALKPKVNKTFPPVIAMYLLREFSGRIYKATLGRSDKFETEG